MADTKQVMSCLENLAEDDWRIFHSESDVQNIAKAALELLKEKEPQSVLSNRVSESYPCRYVRNGFCPKCHQTIEWLFNRNYCGFCGQEVRWDG